MFVFAWAIEKKVIKMSSCASIFSHRITQDQNNFFLSKIKEISIVFWFHFFYFASWALAEILLLPQLHGFVQPEENEEGIDGIIIQLLRELYSMPSSPLVAARQGSLQSLSFPKTHFQGAFKVWRKICSSTQI